MDARCESCGRQLSDGSYFSECWRCSLGATHPAAPFVWFCLFILALAAAWWWGMLAVIGLVGLTAVGASVLTTRRAKRPVTYWLSQVGLAAVSLLLIGFAFLQS
ncbi:MAG TPA: hypothetical protein VHS33_11305 [Sphingomicrobium sp.]|nr:hypothetical protein [Sphingomicrobium sp.]